MSMSLFSFGHPCEHQLRRTCIGGSNCPLNGYPDTWCCSFIKGKINFKRDKPCEGPRCRWGFTHPPQNSFDTVTQVIQEARTIANKIDEAAAAGSEEILSFQIDSPHHIVDTVQCSLHMMRSAPSACGKRIGQLFAYAALKAHDAKVFTALLKTMKKPVDIHLMGAYEYILTAQTSLGPKEPAEKGKGKKGGKNKDVDVLEDLKNDVVEVMNSALCQGGVLVDREEQRGLQQIFLSALKAYPKNRKKTHDMLENALAKFSSVTGSPTSATAGGKDGKMNAKSASATSGPPLSTTTSPSGNKEAEAEETEAKEESPAKEEEAVAKEGSEELPTLSQVAESKAQPQHEAKLSKSEKTEPKNVAIPVMPIPAGHDEKKESYVSNKDQPPQQVVSKKSPAAGLSKFNANQISRQQPYCPIIPGSTLPDIAVLGGLFGLGTNAGATAPLGYASCETPPAAQSPVKKMRHSDPQTAIAPVIPVAAASTSTSSGAFNPFGTPTSGTGYSPLFGPMDVFQTTAPSTAGQGPSAIGNATTDSELFEGVLKAWGQ